jgi:hypothetical protein
MRLLDEACLLQRGSPKIRHVSYESQCEGCVVLSGNYPLLSSKRCHNELVGCPLTFRGAVE